MTREKLVEIANEKLWMLFPGRAAAFVDFLIAIEVIKPEEKPAETSALREGNNE